MYDMSVENKMHMSGTSLPVLMLIIQENAACYVTEKLQSTNGAKILKRKKKNTQTLQ